MSRGDLVVPTVPPGAYEGPISHAQHILHALVADKPPGTFEGRTGRWEKMRNAQSGAKTPGIKPMDAARTDCHSLYAGRKGAVVEIERA